MRAILFYLAIIFIFLVGLSALLPENSLTGSVIDDEVASLERCGALGCAELCDPGLDAKEAEDGGCLQGLVCCPTAWDDGEVGLCDLASNCPAIAAYSADGSLERFLDAHTEEPKAFENIGLETFWLPLFVALLAIAALVLHFRSVRNI